jgi:hypothetical protein
MHFMPSSGASYVAVELAQKLIAVIKEFEQTHPGTTRTHISQALRMVAMQTGASRMRPVILAVVIALVLLGFLAALWLNKP